ncbi:MAG: hypothetical protein AD742_01985 [Methylibium sp. NZG]|nr:MAG: hypothetical protein AD742_01985 [Methylibium sp. NZG]
MATSVTLLAAALLAGCDTSVAQGGPPMAPPVGVAPAVQRSLGETDEFTGRLEATDTVDVRSRVPGTLDKVHFREGQEVAKGALLFTIDSRAFNAELARVQAQLASARSAAELAGTEFARSQKLLEQRAVSQQEFDQANASVRNTKSAVAAAEAAVASARLNVEYSRIRAPLAGRASRANVSVGNLVNAGDPVLTTLVSQDKVYAYFDISESAFLKYGRLARGDGKTGPALPVQMGLSNEAALPHKGVVDFVDNRLTPSTGGIRARAVFDNPQRQFTPGLFVRLRIAAGAPVPTILVPDRAVGTDQSKRFVMVVGADKTAQYREITPGPLVDGMRVVASGLKAGELVVVSGLQRVRPGAPVATELLPVDDKGMPVAQPASPAGPPQGAASAPKG